MSPDVEDWVVKSFRITEDPETPRHEYVLPGSFRPPFKRGRKAHESRERVTFP